MSEKKLLSGCSDAVIAKWLADFAHECAEMRRLTSAPEPPGTFLTFEQLWTQKQETIKSARLCWGTDGRLKGCKHKCLRLQYITTGGKTMAKPNTDFYDCYIAAEELRDVMWSLRNAHETITESGAGFTLKQRGALYTILAMCDKLSNLADILDEIGGRDNE